MKGALLLLGLLFLVDLTDALYWSHETATEYLAGERIPITANKLTSAVVLESLEASEVALCPTEQSRVAEGGNSWKTALTALHGDDFTVPAVDIRMKQAAYCKAACLLDLTADNADTLQKWHAAIRNEFQVQWYFDGVPTGVRIEDDETVSTRYWGGIPLGHQGRPAKNERYAEATDDDLFVYNHWNIEIHTWKLPNKENSYRVIEVIVEPLSILHPFDGELNKRMETPIASCRGEGTHTNYDMLRDIPPQPARGKVHFTYDVKWISLQDGSDPFRSRWDVFLSMDDAVPDVVEIMGFFLGFALTALVLGTLWTWVMRDLSYKPLIGSDDEEENAEMQLWPLSSSVMRPPANHPLILSICCGTGAHLMVTGFFFVLFFRVGIISQSQGADLLTAAVVLAAVFAPVGGYVTGRLMNVMHVRDGKVIAYAASLTTAICYPLFGLFVVLFVYDVLPSSAAPTYNAVANSWPLILVWIFCMWPLSVAGGWLGYKHGPINHFPVSRPAAKDSRRSDSEEGGDGENTYVSTTVDHFVTEEEQEELEEELEQSRRWCFVKKYRIPLLFLVGGIIPVLCSFINYSYGIAGPIFLGYYSVRSFMVFAYIFFVVSAGAFTVLIYYRQLRAQYYEWWWPSFATGSSAGLYIFILSMSWLIHSSSHLEGSTIFAYMLWFALISVGAGLVTGFAGVASCIVFNRVLYSYIMRRNDSD